MTIYATAALQFAADVGTALVFIRFRQPLRTARLDPAYGPPAGCAGRGAEWLAFRVLRPLLLRHL
jgi:hypothetical protein